MTTQDLRNQLKKVREASFKLADLSEESVNSILNQLADLLESRTDEIVKENAKDLAKIEETEHIYDRILLDQERISAIAESLRKIATYDSPVGVVLEQKVLKNGLGMKKVSAPLGVVGAIFEARPNVLIDTFSLCLKSRNAVVMKGGSQANNSNQVLHRLILETLEKEDPELKYCSFLLANDREVVAEFLRMPDLVDVMVPRGGQGLIDYVRENSLIPMIETGRGVCHTFVDQSADLQMAKDIIFNAKTTRPSVCNSLDTLLLHESRLSDLVKLLRPVEDFGVEVFADEKSYTELEGKFNADKLKKASSEDFGREFLSLRMSVKVVNDVNEAITHINTFGSRHSEAIVSENKENVDKFMRSVDSASVYHNA